MSDSPNTRRISPAEGRRVRFPGGRLLEPKTDVAWSPFWERRLADGDIVETAPKAGAEKKD